MSKLRAAKRKKQQKLKAQKAIQKKIESNEFVGSFKGHLTMYMGGEESELISRLKTTGDWVTKRYDIIKKSRKFNLEFFIHDIDGDLRGHKDFDLAEQGNDEDLATAIKQQGDEFIAWIAEQSKAKGQDFIPDLSNCKIKIRA